MSKKRSAKMKRRMKGKVFNAPPRINRESVEVVFAGCGVWGSELLVTCPQCARTLPAPFAHTPRCLSPGSLAGPSSCPLFLVLFLVRCVLQCASTMLRYVDSLALVFQRRVA